jgi:hypothetical protein
MLRLPPTCCDRYRQERSPSCASRRSRRCRGPNVLVNDLRPSLLREGICEIRCWVSRAELLRCSHQALLRVILAAGSVELLAGSDTALKAAAWTGAAVQVPVEAWRLWPTDMVPEICGSAVVTGELLFAAAIVAVAADSAWLLPSVFVAVTLTRIVLPRELMEMK